MNTKPATAAPPIPEAAAAKNKTFACISCGAKLEFQPGLHALKCPYCGAETPIADEPVQNTAEALAKLDYDQHVAIAPEEPELPRQKVTCPACRAESELPPNVTSDRCSYCAAPAIASNAYETRQIKPRALAPFEIQERDARERFTGWVKGLWFAPNALKKMARIDRGLKGFYIPYFTYDALTYTHYSGERGTVYYEEEEVTVNGKTETRRVERVSWQHVTGQVEVDFDDLAIVASKTVPVDHAEALAPWSLEKLVPYTDSYVSGFVVEAYQQGLKSGFERAVTKMQPAIEQAVNADIGGDRQRIHSMSTQYNDKTFRHLLLPLWISAYNYSGKTYRFLVNGQTGAVRGERPWSIVKIVFASLAAIAVGVGIYWLSQNQHGGAGR